MIMFATERKSLAVPVAIFAAVLMLCAALFAFAGASEAKTFPDQGIDEDLEPSTIEMAPGFSYTYTIMFDETLNEGVEVDYVVNTLPEGTQTNITKQVNGATWGTLKVVLASDCAAGQYDLVLKATHADSGQTAYQYIIFDVKSGVTITPTEIQLGNTIQNDVFSKEFVVTVGYGNIQTILKDFGLFDFFADIIESSVVGVRKPDPAIYRLGVEAMGLPAENVLVVGDSFSKDVVPAKTVGCKVAWLKGEGWGNEEIDETLPDVIITDLPELLSYV